MDIFRNAKQTERENTARRRHQQTRGNVVSVAQNRCFAENPLHILAEILPLSCFKSGAPSPKPVFLYEKQEEESVPWVITTDSSDEDVSILDDDKEFFINDIKDQVRSQQLQQRQHPRGLSIAKQANSPYRRYYEPETVKESNEEEEREDDANDEEEDYFFNVPLNSFDRRMV
ncbi:expressed unknown protein [Seminavis robusta]|uniref:Uncharacterized protein n=1 Tax=Seminavis robusta TaxID=568900 RepID=A0A9N8HGM5_9STRA|nr:expressed unknown protein [Seminavis robusta]|eukprot:Sro516_g158560.1 n/a (173) ;mRNA; f:50251-50769